MDETVEFDEIIDDDVFNFFPVDEGPVFVDVVEVLHKDEDFDFEFILVLDEGVFDDEIAFGRCEFNFLLLILLVSVINRADWGIVDKVWLVYERRGLHGPVNLNRSSN